MTRPAFLVDGHLEKKVVQNLCPGSVVRIINCNGDSVKLKVIAKKIASQIRLLGNRNYPIVIVIDRENRTESASQISKSLQDELAMHDLSVEIIIGVADRMIENWILADKQMLSEEFPNTINTNIPVEGSHGKNKIKKIFPSYHETTDGVKLFLKADPIKIYRNSQSFKSFVEKINHVECNWLKRIFESKS